jgi:tetratricopeptide (TPR) repeat protein
MLSLLDKDRAGEALPLLEELVASAPAYAAAYVALARAYETERRWDEAFKTWQKARFLVPNSPAVAAGLRRVAAALAHPGAAATEAWRPAEHAGAVETPVEAPAWTKVGEVVQAERPETEPVEAPPDFEDLDRLIEELESARIVPDPEPHTIPPPDLENEIDDMVSETLAKIYASQNQYEEAARVYEKLAARQPERATEFLHLATEMRRKAS